MHSSHSPVIRIARTGHRPDRARILHSRPAELLFLSLISLLACLTLTAPHAAAADGIIPGGTTLTAGENKTSQNGGAFLNMQHDGNLVLYSMPGGTPVWASGTHSAGARAVFQTDGNLVIYNRNDVAIWHLHTGGQGGTALKVQDDRKLVMYRANGTVVWQTMGPNVNIEFARRLDLVQRDLRAAGYRPKITEAYRTFERQAELYAQGRTKPGNIVTNAKAGQSWHNYGVAADFWLADSNGGSVAEGNIPSAFWTKLGDSAQRQGLVWGGSFTSFKDRPHVELHPGYGSGAGVMIPTYNDAGKGQAGLRAVWNKLGLP